MKTVNEVVDCAKKNDECRNQSDCDISRMLTNQITGLALLQVVLDCLLANVSMPIGQRESWEMASKYWFTAKNMANLYPN